MSASSAYPRLLFVTPHAFNHVMGGGITFSNLFHGWPKDRLACVHCDTVPTSDDVCDQYYRLGPAEIDIAAPLRLAQSVLRRRSAARGADAPAAAAPAGARRSGLRRALQRAVLGTTPPERARLSPALEDWIAGFRPDVLFTILGNNGMMDLIERIRSRFELPLVPHMMDDWPSTAYRDGLLGRWQRQRMRRRLEHAFAVAAVRLGIGTAMCEAFERRYGLPFVPFQNTLDVARWSVMAKLDLTTGSPARLLYVGSIFANAQLQSLIDCAEAVCDLNRAGLPIRLSIASPGFLAEPHRDRIAIGPSVTIEPPITEDAAFFARLAAADALLLPVNFDAGSVRMIRYSMPTKVPAYLLSGTPTLVYGPAGVAQVDYARDRGWGHVLARRDLAALKDGIRRILADGGLRARLSQTARAVAAAEHDAAVVRRRFQSILCQAAGLDARGMKEDAA
jgi:glycosyltransferase involved in cell wall biosynthesis